MRKIFTASIFSLLGFINAQISPMTYSVPGTFSFTVPPSVSSITIETIGAGGKGINNGGGGGGGGGYASGVYAVSPGTILSVKVGSPNVNASVGTSSVGIGTSTLIYATGGTNGFSASTNTVIGGSGAGGSGFLGTISNFNGGAGGNGCWTYFGAGGGGAAGPSGNGGNGGNTPVYNGTNCNTPGGTGGIGGGAPAGNGGAGAGFSNSLCSVSIPAINPTSFGGGGGSGNGIGSPATNGSSGYVRISWGTSTCTPPPAPTASTSVVNICAGNSANLVAFTSGTTIATINWYNVATGGTILATGITYNTGTLAAGTYTYYAGAFTCTNSITRTPIVVNVSGPPTLTANFNPPSMCAGQISTLTLSGASIYSVTPLAIPPAYTVSPSSTTIYTVVGTTSIGCSSTIFVTLPITPSPTLNVTASPSIICSGQSSTLSATGGTSYTWTPIIPLTGIVNPTVTTTYSASTSNSLGCINTKTATIFVSTTPTVNISASSTLICAGQSATLTPSGALVYSWTPSVPLSGVVSPSTTTSYTAVGTGTFGCTGQSAITVSVQNCTGINNFMSNTQNDSFQFYPNPAGVNITIITSNKNTRATIYNIVGELVFQIQLKENQTQLDISNLPNGIYIVQIDKTIKRFIKE